MINLNDSVMKEYISLSLVECSSTNEELARDYKSGIQAAKEKLILKNYGIVKKMAYQFDRRTSPDVNIEDLIQEGLIGLMEAIEKHNPDHIDSPKFISYAVFWIKQRMSRYMRSKSRLIRIPDFNFAEYRKITIARDVLEKKFLREPTLKEIARESGKPISEIMHLKSIFSTIDSLDRSINEDAGELTIGELIEDPNDEYVGIEETSYQVWLKGELDYAFNQYLSVREREILKARFGLDGFKPMQYSEIGSLFKVDSKYTVEVTLKSIDKLRRTAWFVKMKAHHRNERDIVLSLSTTYRAVDERLSARVSH